MQPQVVDLFAPIVAAKRGASPLVIRVGVQAQGVYSAAGVMPDHYKPEAYVLLSALPVELRRQVETAVQALVAGM